MTSNAKRPTNWKAAAPAPLPGPTFAAQQSLPKLPVPELSETLARLKDTLKPIAWSREEYDAVEKKIDAFAAGLGPELQNRLKARAQETGRQHWLEEWWDDLGYLGYRDSVVINVSYYYGFDDHPSHLKQTAAARAAALARGAMLFRQQYKNGQVAPEATREGPLCMDTWRWMFDCCRIPGLEGLDWSTTYAKQGDDGTSGHIVVLRKGRVWKIDAWQNGHLLSVAELEKQFEAIYNGTTHEYPGIGQLTASNRDMWAKNYALLHKEPNNAKILEEIHSSAFVVCLDTEKPSNLLEHSRMLWHGAVTGEGQNAVLGLRNRWVDKPVQFIVFDNGKAGIMGEHSVMDGTPTATMCDRVLDLIASPSFDQGTDSTGSVQQPTPLDWTISPAVDSAVEDARKEALALVETQTMNIERTPYGKAAIKAFGVSPDGWAQMIVQLAYARLLKSSGQKRQGGTYEAATTRKFLKGRTEAIRVVSEESDAWVESMDQPHASHDTRLSLFKAAVKKHGGWARMAGNGLGVDRHLLGLKLTKREGEELPSLYADPVYNRSNNWVLSTSAIFSKHFHPYGWGEVVPEGFGVAYVTGYDDFLQYTVTSRKEMPNKQFCNEIEKAAQDLYALHAEASVPRATL
ncbi:carnitine acetyl transferase [Irpex rosettiformis]|uniref:Carnitine acetyl transferase n=1 Tax=Irpex rosettiformis TaxID=378272 RepID=A0ACB8UB51_9APHY|nr:carnitine acetyl transferase [Irpex rosettiformis]